MGIEALSRGAKSAYFVDISPRSLAVVRENLKTTNLLDQARIYQSDAVDFLQAVSQKFEIAILDPPYRKEMLIHVLPLLEFAMRKSGLVVCEHETELHLSAEYGFLKLQKQKKYGTVTITTYQCRRDEI